MAKRLIQRMQVIDCGVETCGKCSERNGLMCMFWETLLDLVPRKKASYVRLYDCKKAELPEQPAAKSKEEK